MTATDSKFDYRRFIELSIAALQSDYLQKIKEEEPYYFNQFLEVVNTVSVKIEEGESTEDFDELFYEICSALQDLIVADDADVFSEPFAALVHLVYLQAIQRGNAVMTNDYGTFFYVGRFGKQDFQAAAKYYAMASRLGNEVATRISDTFIIMAEPAR